MKESLLSSCDAQEPQSHLPSDSFPRNSFIMQLMSSLSGTFQTTLSTLTSDVSLCPLKDLPLACKARECLSVYNRAFFALQWNSSTSLKGENISHVQIRPCSSVFSSYTVFFTLYIVYINYYFAYILYFLVSCFCTVNIARITYFDTTERCTERNVKRQ